MTKEEIDKLISDHWFGYTEQLIELLGADKRTINLCEFIFRSAWNHGVKHEREAIAEEMRKVKLFNPYSHT